MSEDVWFARQEAIYQKEGWLIPSREIGVIQSMDENDKIVDEAELKAIEVDHRKRYYDEGTLSKEDFYTLASLIAEVRRLKGENEKLRNPPKMSDIARQIEAGGVNPFGC